MRGPRRRAPPGDSGDLGGGRSGAGRAKGTPRGRLGPVPSPSFFFPPPSPLGVFPPPPLPSERSLGCPVSWWAFLPGKLRITWVRLRKAAGGSCQLPCGSPGSRCYRTFSVPTDFTASDAARGGRGERKGRSLVISPAFLQPPRGPAPRSPCQLRTMHLLEVLCLGCCLAAGAVLLGPRHPAAAAAYESGQGYEEESEAGEAKAHASKDLEEQLRSVSSVDELMTVLYPEYWKMFKCQLRKGGWQHNREHSSFDTRSDESLKFAAAHYNAEILKSIDTEWRKTQCMPREVCVDVGKEFGATTNTFFKPPCVSIYRCGGCCNSEGLQCMNISTNYISKTLFEITVPLSHGPKPVTISFANHTSCRCMSKLDVYRQVHSIIRRSLPATQTQCHVVNKTCPKNHIWNNQICRCLAQHDFDISSHVEVSDTSEGFHICGPNKELDEETCQCVCKGGMQPSSCGPHKELDRSSCQCICKNKLLPASCGPNKEFDEDKCQCVCKKTCPKHQPLNPAKCICECIESPNKCFLKGKRFHHQTCSCYRPPCTVRTKRCDSGFYFSEEVCRCVPTYWKRPLMN
ncbi:vascular endothelial growth factor C [Cuculus canorus]|uniref:vascular endothelial growth factor C n=1 Tax=Cuculus canorus TaxID=55661 RepID=UPI0023AAC1D0|nr:vascular endothelial growth factor C [Cuculus canorus]